MAPTENKNKVKKQKKIDYLSEDEEVPNQKWVIMSFVSPEGIANCKIRAVKVRGVYSDKDMADIKCKEFSELHPDHNVFIGEVGKWLGWDPNPESVEDERYHEDKLQNLMKNYKQNRSKARTMEAERKADMLADAFQDKMSNKDKTTRRLQHKLKKRKEATDVKDRQQKDYDEKLKEINDKKALRVERQANKNTAIIEEIENGDADVEDVEDVEEIEDIETGEVEEIEIKTKSSKIIDDESDDDVIDVPTFKTTQDIHDEIKEERGGYEEQKELSKNENDRIKNINENIDDREENIKVMDDKLAKIRNLYKDLQSKSKKK